MRNLRVAHWSAFGILYVDLYIKMEGAGVHMAETHSQARASSPYELVPNILRYSFNPFDVLRYSKIRQGYVMNKLLIR